MMISYCCIALQVVLSVEHRALLDAHVHLVLCVVCVGSNGAIFETGSYLLKAVWRLPNNFHFVLSTWGNLVNFWRVIVSWAHYNVWLKRQAICLAIDVPHLLTTYTSVIFFYSTRWCCCCCNFIFSGIHRYPPGPAEVIKALKFKKG